MTLFLKHAIFVNRAPFENLELDFKESGVNVLSAINGKGKTTILSHIVDALYELAKPHFQNEFEDKPNKYYRVSSRVFNLRMSQASYVYLRFVYKENENEENWDYLDIRNKCTEEEYNESITIEDKIPYAQFSHSLNENENVKHWNQGINSDKVHKAFNNNILTYFPSYRYEIPGYLNDPYTFKIEHKIDSGFSGYLPNPIETYCQFKNLANWLLDVVLDNVQQVLEINNLGQVLMPYIQNNPNSLSHEIASNPRLLSAVTRLQRNAQYLQSSILANVNKVFSHALSTKYDMPLQLHVGARSLGGIRINVVKSDNENEIIYPSIFNMSSGEKALVAIFVELLRQMDNLHIMIDKISGVVMIDEIDKNLHIKMQHEILPKLLKMFPNVQFIVSSHSPFLNMCLADEMEEKAQIIDLDNNGIACMPRNNDLYREVYDLMINENDRFANKLIELQAKINEQNKTIVITEGKTDIKHILKAKEKLGVTDIDFATIDASNQPDGDTNLYALLEQVSKVNRQYKIIGIFDRDVEKTVGKIEVQGQRYKVFGNGVYAFCIPLPQARRSNHQTKISIEYLYSDQEIQTELDNGCRLFFGTEFKDHSVWHKTENLTLAMPKGKGEDKIIENNGGQAVYDSDENNHLAKKDDFAEAVVHDRIIISNQSWQNFMPIFETIGEIIAQ